MMRLSALLLLTVITLAGAAYGADEPAADATQPTTPSTGQPGVVTPAEAVPIQIPVTEQPEKPVNAINLMVGLYKPINSQTADLFGDNWLRFGLKTLPVTHLPQWRPTFDINYYAMSKTFLGPPNLKNRATLIPATVGITRGFGSQEKRWLYVSVGAGPFYGQVNAPTIGVKKSGFGLNANAIVGIHLHRKWILEGRYEFFSKFADQNFDAFVISLAYSLKELKPK